MKQPQHLPAHSPGILCRRHSRLIHAIVFVLFATMAPACMAAQYTLANANLQFYVPDGWSRIMSSQGDREMQVFEVPAASSSDQGELSRVTVSSEEVSDIAAFQTVVHQDNERAQSLPHYLLDKRRSTPTLFYYTATDGSVAQTYVVHYYLHDGHAIRVQCVHPSRLPNEHDWLKAFNKGCDAIGASIH